MRSLDERVAEINRRSEEIIQLKKKRRKMALAGCVPAVLCICILATLAVPDRQTTESCTPGETGCYSGGMYGIADGAMMDTVIEVTGSDFQLSHSTAASVSKILETIDHLLPSNQENSLAAESAYGSAACGGVGYTITINQAGENLQTYLLQGDSLIDCRTGDFCDLTKMELQILKTVLGISAAEE